MSRGAPRWDDDGIRQRFPLPAERLDSPRTDGLYLADNADTTIERLRFRPDGRFTADATVGTWHCERGILRLAADEWHAEGAVGIDNVQLLVTNMPGLAPRRSWEFTFQGEALE